MLPLLPSLATVLALLLFLALGINVSRARGRYKVDAPATTGDPDFERTYRIHQNTLEQLVLFLPALWLFTRFVDPTVGGLIGFVWIIGRVLYAVNYQRDPKARGPGFVVGGISTVVLLVGALGGIVRAFSALP
jgi:glutathione S-transferase